MPRFLPTAVLAAALIGFLPGRAADAQDAKGPIRSAVPLPGGTASLAEALGSPRPFDRAFAVLDAARIAHENPPGESAETDVRRRRLVAHLTQVRESGTRGPGSRAETVPLPLTPADWSSAILDRRVRDDELALAILEDRQAALLYCGLWAMDDETLRALASDRKTIRLLYEQHAAVLAAFGGALRVRNGAVQVPGGDDARPVWEALVKAPASPPAPFVLALLAADAGRLAFFYDTADGFDDRRRRWLLGLDLPEQARVAAALATYQVIATAQEGWQVSRRPFTRPAVDIALVLRWMQFEAGGRPVGPLWPALIGRVFEDLPAVLPGTYGGEWLPNDSGIQTTLAGMDPAAPLEPAWLAGRLLAPLPQVGRQRLDALLFGQRVFPTPNPRDAADILLALRGRIVFPTLVATLERLGVREPALYARAVRHAARFIEITNRGEATASLLSLQACLAILDRSARERAIDPSTARTLVADLLAIESGASQGYRGAIARWIDARLLPAIWRVTGESIQSSSAEFGVLRAIAGDVPWPDPPARVEWEGRAYEINRGAAEFARLRALRENQGGNNLDQVIDVCRTLADALEVGSADESVIADMVAVREALRGLAAPEAAPLAGLPLPDARALAQAAIERANAGDRAGALDALRPLVSYADALLADTLTSIVYAVHLGAPDGPALSGGNVAVRHDLGLAQKRTMPWQVAPGWTFPAEDQAGGWHVTGSLLGLDIGLSRLSLRWLSFDEMPPMPLINANERRTFAETVALLNLFEVSDADRDRMVAVLDRGRARLASLSPSDPDATDRVAADAHLSPRRRQILRWMVQHDPEQVARSVSLLEQFWVGGGAGLALDGWGVSAMPSLGCTRTVFPSPEAWEPFAGHPAQGLVGTRLPDLALRAAQELHARSLPAALAPGILAAATTALLHEAQPAYHDDWMAIARYVRDLPSDRFVDHISSLTAAGPLVPARDEKGDSR